MPLGISLETGTRNRPSVKYRVAMFDCHGSRMAGVPSDPRSAGRLRTSRPVANAATHSQTCSLGKPREIRTGETILPPAYGPAKAGPTRYFPGIPATFTRILYSP